MLGARYFGFEFMNRIDSSAILHTWDVTSPPSSSSSSSPAHNATHNKGEDNADSETAATAGTPMGAAGIDGGVKVTAPGGGSAVGVVVGAHPEEVGVDLAVSEGGGGGRADRAGSEGKANVARVSYEVGVRGWVRVGGLSSSAVLIVTVHSSRCSQTLKTQNFCPVMNNTWGRSSRR